VDTGRAAVTRPSLPDADIALAMRGTDAIDVGVGVDSQTRYEAGADLPVQDRSVQVLRLGDAVASLPARDQLHLLAECRRALAPGGHVVLVEPGAATLRAALSRWATLVGLTDLPAGAPARGWAKHEAGGDAQPLVSILIPSSNPRYFLECLDSAIAQTYPRIEIIVSDDSEGPEIGDLVASRSDRADVRFVFNPVRLRARGNYTQCLEMARGEYIKFLNDDDVLEPDCVRTLMSAFLQVPDITLATSHRLRIDAASRPLSDMPATRPAVPCDAVVNGISLANAAIMYGLNFIGEPSTALFRKRDLVQGLELDPRPFTFDGEEVRGAIDLAMWPRLLLRGNAVFFHARLSRFRIHGQQAQAQDDVVARSVVGIRGLQRKWIELGLFRMCPPSLLLCQPFPRDREREQDWFLEPVRCFAPLRIAPGEAMRQWRATKHHSFDFTLAPPAAPPLPASP
jgi:hypothetical protein